MSDDSDFGMGDETDLLDSVNPIEPTVGVVRVGKRDYAVGLYWNSVNVSTNAVAEAREMASSERIAADYFCVRPGLSSQFGLGFKDMGHKSSMPSLAVHIATSRPGSWIGLFEVTGGYYLIAVRDDGILAECDKFFSSGELAREAFENFRSQSDWQEAFAPKSLRIPGTKHFDITSMLEGRPPARLREVRRSVNAIRMLIAAVAIGGVLIGGMYYIDGVEQQRLQDELARRAAEAAQKVGVGKETVVVPPMPWEGKPNAVAVLRACRDHAGRLQSDIPGWNLISIQCRDTLIAASLQRRAALGKDGGGPVTWIAPYINKPGFTPSIDYSPEGTGNGLTRIQWSLGELTKIPVDLQTQQIAFVKRRMQEVMEKRMTPIEFASADSNEFWKGMTFRFHTGEDPILFEDLIGSIRGAIITKMEFKLSDKEHKVEWTLEGKVYEQLPLPKQVKR